MKEKLNLHKLSEIKGWINKLLEKNEGQMIAVNTLGFNILPKYFSESLLSETNVIFCKTVPVAPLNEMGLHKFSEMESKEFIGMTYLDCFFLREDNINNESLFFHELIHIIQWRYLGIDKFLICYAIGLFEKGYRNSMLEKMAYNHQNNFDNGIIYDVEESVLSEMKYFDKLLEQYNLWIV